MYPHSKAVPLEVGRTLQQCQVGSPLSPQAMHSEVYIVLGAIEQPKFTQAGKGLCCREWGGGTPLLPGSGPGFLGGWQGSPSPSPAHLLTCVGSGKPLPTFPSPHSELLAVPLHFTFSLDHVSFNIYINDLK